MTLYDYMTGDSIREATSEEIDASETAAKYDGGAGVILVADDGDLLYQYERGASDARRCYVSE